MDLGEPAPRARGHPAQVVGDLVERDGDRPQHPGRLDEGVAGSLGLEVVTGLGERQPGRRGEPGDHLGANPGLAFSPVPTAVPPSGSSATRASDGLEPLDAVLDRRGVAAEFLAEGHRGRVHQVGAARLHDLGELALLARATPKPGAPGPG